MTPSPTLREALEQCANLLAERFAQPTSVWDPTALMALNAARAALASVPALPGELPESELAELERLADGATPGPWRPEREPPPVGNPWFDALPAGSFPVESTGTFAALGMAVAASPHAHDADFIAASRTAVPKLIRALRAARRTS